MLSSFGVTNFKSIKRLRLQMRPFMVLVGPNGAGKTNVVRALELFGDLLARGTTDPARELSWGQIIRREKKPATGGMTFAVTVDLPEDALNMRPLREGRMTLDVRLKLQGSVDTDEVRATEEKLTLRSSLGPVLSVVADRAGVRVEAGDDAALWLELVGLRIHKPRSPQEAMRDLTLLFDARALERETGRRVLRLLNLQRFSWPWLVYLASAARVSLLRLDASALRSDSAFREAAGGNLLGPSGERLAMAVDKLRGRGKKPAPAFQRVLAGLRSVYPRIEDVRAQRIQPGRLSLLFRERGISEELGQANVSDGVLHALALLVMLEGEPRRRSPSEAPGILAIEEPENAIHPWSVSAMMGRAQQPGARQVLVTTHSETVVNAVEDPAALFVVENESDAGTTVTPALYREAALAAILRETGQKLGDVWMGGALGGVPRSEP
jgi:predicted ATPase